MSRTIKPHLYYHKLQDITIESNVCLRMTFRGTLLTRKWFDVVTKFPFKLVRAILSLRSIAIEILVGAKDEIVGNVVKRI